MNLEFQIVYQDEHLFVIDKPEGYFVHPPEASPYPPPLERICLHVLREHFRKDVYPVHRLDSPTSGLVVFTMSKEATRRLSAQFQRRETLKKYQAVVRGYVDNDGSISLPLEVKGFGKLECETHYQKIASREFPIAVGKKYPTARYSLVEVRPVTGRWHQIRRHFDQIAHPLLGDIEHGDSHHNRFFRDHLKITGLCLRATSLAFTHPFENYPLLVNAKPNEKWMRIQEMFSIEKAEGSKMPGLVSDY